MTKWALNTKNNDGTKQKLKHERRKWKTHRLVILLIILVLSASNSMLLAGELFPLNMDTTERVGWVTNHRGDIFGGWLYKIILTTHIIASNAMY